MDGTFNPERFVLAQERVYGDVIQELRGGRKQSHWMWFIFPQLAGLGRSSTAQYYALDGLEAARTYVAHAVLGPRLVECAALLTTLAGEDPVAVFGAVDAQKLQSSMTLFSLAAPHEPVFEAVLDKYFAGELDEGTTSRI